MKGKKIALQLNTPIFIDVTDENSPGRIKSESVTKISGLVLETADAGLFLEISELLGERGQKVSALHRQLYLPMHKVDHCFVI